MKFTLKTRSTGAVGGKLIVIVAFVVLLGLTAYLYAERSRQTTELARLRAVAAESESMQQDRAELERLRAQAGQLAQLQQDNQELVKLRGEVSTLRPLQAQAQKLQTELQQLKASMDQLRRSATDSATLRTQNEKLQGVLVEQQRTSQALACIANLKAISGAKIAWATDLKKAPTDFPTEGELFGPNRYMAQRPVCPANGEYTIGAAHDKVTCNVPGHAY